MNSHNNKNKQTNEITHYFEFQLNPNQMRVCTYGIPIRAFLLESKEQKKESTDFFSQTICNAATFQIAMW